MKKFKDWFYWYGDLVGIAAAVLLVLGVIVGGVVWSAVEYNGQVEKCNNAGGVYLKGQCVEGKVIKL